MCERTRSFGHPVSPVSHMVRGRRGLSGNVFRTSAKRLQSIEYLVVGWLGVCRARRAQLSGYGRIVPVAGLISSAAAVRIWSSSRVSWAWVRDGGASG